MDRSGTSWRPQGSGISATRCNRPVPDVYQSIQRITDWSATDLSEVGVESPTNRRLSADGLPNISSFRGVA